MWRDDEVRDITEQRHGYSPPLPIWDLPPLQLQLVLDHLSPDELLPLSATCRSALSLVENYAEGALNRLVQQHQPTTPS